MRIGISLPQHGSAATPDGLIAVAKRAEALGYDSLWVGDRLMSPVHPKSPYPIGDGTHPLPFRSLLEPVAALTLVAGHTERVTLGTSVLILPIYQPIVLARQLMTLDVLSKGRLRLGLRVIAELTSQIRSNGIVPSR
jgi:alkanesulfonate monooxygenase SsuD/methylene tetrahydromethanopterin reductase-like flavin-dependent oxidoreductase (luciferase family)